MPASSASQFKEPGLKKNVIASRISCL